MAELSSYNRVYDQQHLKYLLSIPVENTFAYQYFRLYAIMKKKNSYVIIEITATQLQIA